MYPTKPTERWKKRKKRFTQRTSQRVSGALFVVRPSRSTDESTGETKQLQIHDTTQKKTQLLGSRLTATFIYFFPPFFTFLLACPFYTASYCFLKYDVIFKYMSLTLIYWLLTSIHMKAFSVVVRPSLSFFFASTYWNSPKCHSEFLNFEKKYLQ